MRRVHGSRRRTGGPFLLDAGRRRRRQEDHHHRGPRAGRRAHQGAAGLGQPRCPAMRLLPMRNDHGGLRASRREAEAHRQGHRRRDHQYLSLRHLPAGPRSDPHGCERVKGTAMNYIPNMIRRSFLIGTAAAGGGLAIGIPFALDSASAQTALSTPELGVWVVVKPDDSVVVRIVRAEMGQGTITGLAQLVAEELDADWTKVTYEHPGPAESVKRKRPWGSYSTGGSRGIRESHEYVRQGGAAARMMLMQAAANEWKVPVGEVTASAGVLTHKGSNRTLTYG